jgi:hypothetical protein
MVIGWKSLPAHQDHFSTYKTVPRSRQYPPKHSYYKWINTALRIANILVAVQQVTDAEGWVYLLLRVEVLRRIIQDMVRMLSSYVIMLQPIRQTLFRTFFSIQVGMCYSIVRSLLTSVHMTVTLLQNAEAVAQTAVSKGRAFSLPSLSQWIVDTVRDKFKG